MFSWLHQCKYQSFKVSKYKFQNFNRFIYFSVSKRFLKAGGLKGGCIRIGRTRICGAKGGAIVGNRVNRIHDDDGFDDVEGRGFAITI